MTTPAELDTLLENGLATAVRDVNGDPRLTQELVDGAVTRLRRRRRFGIAAVGAVTSLAVLATGLVGWQLRDGSRAAAPATQVPRVAPTYTVKPAYAELYGTYAWAEALPRGEDAPAAFVSGQHLVVDGHAIDLGDHVSAQLDAPLPGGWLAELWHIDQVGNQTDVAYGLLSRTGAFRAFSFKHEPGSGHNASGWASSPDGSRVTYGGSIVNVSTGQWVRHLPRSARVVQAWTADGIAFRDSRGQNMIWAPGSAPRASDWGYASPVQAIQYRRDCATAGLLEDGSVHPLGTVCGDGIAAFSNNGFAVTSSGQVIDLDTGSRLGSIPVPPPVDGIFGDQIGPLFWTDDDLLVFGVSSLAVRGRGSLQVSCDVRIEHLTCARASEILGDGPVTEFDDP